MFFAMPFQSSFATVSTVASNSCSALLLLLPLLLLQNTVPATSFQPATARVCSNHGCFGFRATNHRHQSLHMVPPAQDDAFIAKQKGASQGKTFDDEPSFLQHQKEVFNALADTFSSGETIPPELDAVYEHLAKNILLQQRQQQAPPVKILDVACGTGALWPYLAKTASSKGVALDIVGVDLSDHMVAAAAVHADALFEEYLYSDTRHTFAVLQSDILAYKPSSSSSSSTSDDKEMFDLVVANACFGNFWNQTAVLEHCSRLLKENGVLAVTHPLGASFVNDLHTQDPGTVPYLLPESESGWTDLTLTLPLQLIDLIHPVESINGTKVPLYAAILQKQRARALPKIVRLRGEVDSGFGRGGKKLGFPTANLPSRLFQDALESVSPGVYFGWAILEGDSAGRNVAHKAVVNVGYSPTFEGQENTEKIVEAHLIFDEGKSPLDPPDFYGETMRLQLSGFLRPEIKFPSFPDLIAQINADVKDAQAALDTEPFKELRSDAFLTQEAWIGATGGDSEASWEFQNIREALGVN